MTGRSLAAALPVRTGAALRSPWVHVGQAAAALAAGMGVGRFVYTPILPLMHAQAGLSATTGANLATANYAGYLLGALAGSVSPALIRRPAPLRAALVVLTMSLAAMPFAGGAAVWITLRLIAGVSSALIFVTAASSLLSHLREHPTHLPGWAFGGIGGGIALSGLLVLVLRSAAGWPAAWWASALLAALLTAAAWNLRPETPPATPARTGGVKAGGAALRGRFAVLFTSYTLEGVGYIVAATFLAAAIEETSPGWVGSCAWVLVGVAAVPSAALWARLGRRWPVPGLLLTALVIQAGGIVLPALVPGVTAALVAAVLFGATFIGVSTLCLDAGARLRFPRSVALLTAGYSVGQILGPLVVAPLLRHGYHQALILAGALVLAAAVAAAVLRVRFPRHSA